MKSFNMYTREKYKGFTLVELLIVMGILAILMTIGIAVGRFAIQRASNVQHQSAADDVFDALQAYYTDNRSYPTTATLVNIKTAMGSAGILGKYVDTGWDGGSAARYFYFVTTDGQSALVCVSLGGKTDTANQGYYCTGNGFGTITVGTTTITTKQNANGSAGDTALQGLSLANPHSDWSGTAWE